MQAEQPNTTRRAILTGAAALTAAAATGLPAGAQAIIAETEIQRLARERLRLKAIAERIHADADKVYDKYVSMLPEKPRILMHNGLGKDELYTRTLWERSRRWEMYQTPQKRAEAKALGDGWFDEDDRIRAAFHVDEIETRREASDDGWIELEDRILEAKIANAEDARIKLDIFRSRIDGEPEGLEAPLIGVVEQMIALSAH